MADAPTPNPPEQDQSDDAIEPDATTDTPEVEDGARVAEAGNAYVGRTMDDSLKTSPRVEDGDEAVDESGESAEPGDGA